MVLLPELFQGNLILHSASASFQCGDDGSNNHWIDEARQFASYGEENDKYSFQRQITCQRAANSSVHALPVD
jgi:hypothetical protein